VCLCVSVCVWNRFASWWACAAKLHGVCVPQPRWRWAPPHSPSPCHVGCVRERQMEPFFSYHHINAFETPAGDIVLDLVAYPDNGILTGPYAFGRLDVINTTSGMQRVPPVRTVWAPAVHA
jgi:hypothetical protein